MLVVLSVLQLIMMSCMANQDTTCTDTAPISSSMLFQVGQERMKGRNHSIQEEATKHEGKEAQLNPHEETSERKAEMLEEEEGATNQPSPGTEVKGLYIPDDLLEKKVRQIINGMKDQLVPDDLVENKIRQIINGMKNELVGPQGPRGPQGADGQCPDCNAAPPPSPLGDDLTETNARVSQVMNGSATGMDTTYNGMADMDITKDGKFLLACGSGGPGPSILWAKVDGCSATNGVNCGVMQWNMYVPNEGCKMHPSEKYVLVSRHYGLVYVPLPPPGSVSGIGRTIPWTGNVDKDGNYRHIWSTPNADLVNALAFHPTEPYALIGLGNGRLYKADLSSLPSSSGTMTAEHVLGKWKHNPRNPASDTRCGTEYHLGDITNIIFMKDHASDSYYALVTGPMYLLRKIDLATWCVTVITNRGIHWSGGGVAFNGGNYLFGIGRKGGSAVVQKMKLEDPYEITTIAGYKKASPKLVAEQPYVSGSDVDLSQSYGEKKYRGGNPNGFVFSPNRDYIFFGGGGKEIWMLSKQP